MRTQTAAPHPPPLPEIPIGASGVGQGVCIPNKVPGGADAPVATRSDARL